MRLENLKVGQKTDVAIRRIHDDGGIDLALWAPEPKVGQFYRGFIAGFYDPKGHREAAFVELHPGVEGFLHVQQMSFQQASSFPKWSEGQWIDVAVTEKAGDKLSLATKDVFESRDWRPAVGSAFSGIIAGYYPQTGAQEAVFVELVPGRQGFLHRRQLGRFPEFRLKSLRLGESIDVEINSVQPNGKFDLKLFFHPIQIGPQYRGLVVSFLPGQYGHARAGAFLELVPGIQGLLHHSQVSDSFLSQLNEGHAIDVVVFKVEPGLGGKMRYSLRPA